MTRSALSTIAYEALVRARSKFSNREERCIREIWTAEQELVLLRLYPDMPNEVLAARLNKTVQQIYAKAHRLGLKKSPELAKQILQACGRKLQIEGNATQFKKGHTPWNCGMKGLLARGRSSETQFKKGQKPHTWLPVGSTRVSADGYLQRKISDTGYPPRDWKGMHILLWEEHFGPIPTGHCVCFKDNNKQ
ncbi:HNH endonuclease, partial [Pseudomonas aeruginosa]